LSPNKFREAPARSQTICRRVATVGGAQILDGEQQDKEMARDRKTMSALLMWLAASGATLAASSAVAADPTGEWMVADHTARIRIEKCPDGYWGSIAWEREPGRDTHNPDPKKRGQPMLGTPILLSMKAANHNEWDGKVYNPKDGGFYNASIKLAGPNTLNLQGCMLIFCSGETWTRANDTPHATTGSAAARPESACPH
jgi:uncharacterized protein (DUF2147 family)